MSIYKRINDKVNDRESFMRIVDYVTKKPYTDWETNVGVIGCRKGAILQDMMAVKTAYHQNKGKYYEHGTLSITPDSPLISDDDYMEIGRRIASNCIGMQCVYALHKDTKIRHLHIVWNNISYIDGKRFSQGPPGLNKEKAYINSILEKYNLDPIRSSPAEMIESGGDIRHSTRFLEIDDDYPEKRNTVLVSALENEKTKRNDYEYSNEYSGLFWFQNGGNYMYNNNYNYNNTEVTQRTPVATQAATISTGNTDDGNGLNLVNVNNIRLGSLNDLSQATADLNDTFTNSARAGAEALATLRQHGVDEGVTVTTVNNYFVSGSNDSNRGTFDIIDVPYKD